MESDEDVLSNMRTWVIGYYQGVLNYIFQRGKIILQCNEFIAALWVVAKDI